ncbi:MULTISPECIES: hypothetical protein [unclassified Variovorax]|uniref:hypothetical protein n=1 Tax=unclassified Variovorax TaxID=663243 RepID=UPI00076C5F78|nr:MULTISPECIES: hypothetical protein [unclassified Variovorax]KWT97336.1 hypothetical protein APY03_1535 [Variovorax sp. WDL1]PNG60007.1 hypothetical protein CHC07_01736 [Variovorax sp. B4]PNG60201.1 hypothetical protein CHC06_00098 [Variovorax sp. B2]VTV13971.1 hypothetical protein WDL1CHR_04573 [Variovorax sp. WDL1]
MSDKFDARAPWDASFAARLPGKLLLVGLTYLDADGKLIDKQQIFGRIMSATPRDGISLRLEGRRTGERYSLPPDTRAFRKVRPGQYRLHATGEVVVDPDYTVTFTIQKQARRPPATIH